MVNSNLSTKTRPQSDESVRESQVNTDDTPKIVALLESQVQDLKEQLDTATEGESGAAQIVVR